MEYEICYLIGESKETELDSIKKGVEEIITHEGGVLLDSEFLEKRKMAYEIKKEIRGTYIAKRFTVVDKDEREEDQYPEKDIISEITTKMNLNNDVLRFIVIKADDLPELNASKEQEDAKMEVEKPEINPAKKVEKKKEVKREIPKVEKKEEMKEEKPKVEKKKEEVKKEKPKAEKKEEKKEDFDKKLDEILNI